MKPLQLNWRMEEEFESHKRLGEGGGGGGVLAEEEGQVGGGLGCGSGGENIWTRTNLRNSF